MSYASSDKSFPTLWKRIPQKLSHPTAIAVIASVGIHAALGLSLPYLPISSQEKPKPVRNVQLLELKPDELNRLPESPLALAPLPPGLNQQLKPLPSSPSDSSSVRGIPALPSTDPSLSDFSSIGPVASLGGSSGRVGRRSTNLDKTVRVKSSLLNDLKTKEPPLPSEVFNSQGGKSATNPQFKIAGSNKTSSTSRRELSRLVDGLSASNEEPTLPDSSNSNQLSEPLPPTPMSPLAGNPGITRSQSPNQFGTPMSTESFDQRNQAAAPTLGQSNLTNNTATRNFNAFMQRREDWNKRNQVLGEPEDLGLIEGKYPEKARSAGLPSGSVVVNWKVDKNGSIIPGTLEVIASSEGGVFDQDAIATIRKRAFQATGTEKAYTVRVIFKDDKLVPETSTGPSKTPTERPNSSDRSTSTDGKTGTERQNSSDQLTVPTPLTLPQSPTSPESSTQPKREIPLLPQNSLEQSTPSSQPKPGDKPSTELGSPSPTQQLTPSSQPKPGDQPSTDLGIPTQQLTPSSQPKPGDKPLTDLVVPTQQLTPSSQPKPGDKPSTDLGIPTQQLTPSSQPKPGDKPSTDLGIPTQQLTPSSQPKPGDSQTRTERQNSPEPRSSSESQNSEKPPKLSEPPSSEKPLRLPEPPNPAKR